MYSYTVSAALELHAQNFFSFPLNGKTPLFAGWNRGKSNLTRLQKWFEDRPEANLGLRTGDGIFAIDLDAKHDGEAVFRDFVGMRHLPVTATALTGGGGTHLLFKVPKNLIIRNSVGWKGLPGVDVRGQSGFIVVEPSIHPVTGCEYVWTRTPRMGIATAPTWLIEELNSSSRRTRKKPKILGPTRIGVAGDLAADLIARFPIGGPGQRAGVFAKVVPSVLGRGFDEATVVAAVWDWWKYHHELGLCNTAPQERVILRYIEQLKASPTFGQADGQTSHRSACREMRLPDQLEQAIQGTNGVANASLVSIDTMGVTWTPHEAAFVEAIAVHALHEIALGRSGAFKFTRDQIREIASDRHPDIRWDNQQFERLKSKFIDRSGKPATRTSLLRQISAGNRAYGKKVAAPSCYEPTGIASLIGHPDLAMVIPEITPPPRIARNGPEWPADDFMDDMLTF